MKIKRIGVMSLAKILGVLYGGMGFVFGIFFAIASFFGTTTEDAPFNLGVLSIIAFPVLYGFMGLLSGIISAFFFNLAAKWVGSLEIETE